MSEVVRVSWQCIHPKTTVPFAFAASLTAGEQEARAGPCDTCLLLASTLYRMTAPCQHCNPCSLPTWQMMTEEGFLALCQSKSSVIQSVEQQHA